MATPVVEAVGLGKRYRGGFRGTPVEALIDFDLTIQPGEVFGLLGPNGAGKTTFIKALLGVIRPTSGSARLLGYPVGTPNSRTRVGYLPEQHRFPGYLTARQALDMYARLGGLPRPVRRSETTRLLKRVDLTEWADVKTRKFSKGMMQRLGLAQALMGDPEIVVLDEPTDGVDPIGRRAIREIVAWLRDSGTTVFLNSHLLSEVEMVCTRVAILNKGRLISEGTVSDLTTAPKDWEVEGRSAKIPVALPPGVTVSLAPAPTVENAVQPSAPDEGATPGPPAKASVAGDEDSGLPAEDPGAPGWSTYRVEAASAEELTARLGQMIDSGITIRQVLPGRRTLEQAFVDIVSEVDSAPTGESL